MMHAVLLMTLWAGAPPVEGQYSAAAVNPPSDATPVKILSAWDSLLAERGLAPDMVDHKAGVALGDWLARPHVCAGQVRYHAVVAAEKVLRVYVVAECAGEGASLERAAVGLATELSQRLGSRSAVSQARVADVPARLWEVRLARGNTTPPPLP